MSFYAMRSCYFMISGRLILVIMWLSFNRRIKKVLMLYEARRLTVFISDDHTTVGKLAINCTLDMTEGGLKPRSFSAGFTASTGKTPGTMSLNVYNFRLFRPV